MTHPQTELPIVEIDGRHWSREKRILWRAAQSFAKSRPDRLDLNTEIMPAVLGLSCALFPHLPDYDRQVLCTDVILELREAFRLVCEDGTVQ